MLHQLLFICCLLVSFLFYQVSAANVVCYYISSNGYSAAPPEDLDPNLCTHLNYAFVSLASNGSLTYANKKLDIDLDLYGRVVALKDKNPNLKVLLSVGGVASSIFSEVIDSSTKRAVFISSSRKFLETYKFDGIDIDWEFPSSSHKVNFMSLLKELRKDFGSKWLITAAVAAIPRTGYDIPLMSETLDFLNIMSYDFYGAWSVYTGQNSALFKSSIESAYEKKYLNVAATAANWVNAGAEAKKVNVGIAFYGRQFTLAHSSSHGLHANITGAGTRVSATYSQICQGYQDWTRVWDDEQKNPYKYLGNQWIGYDDEESVQLKAQYILSNNYGGVMVWHLGGDDVYGKCGESQGLLKIINKEIDSYNKEEKLKCA